MDIKNNLNFGQNQIINVVLHPSATDPANGKEAQFYYNTTNKGIMYYDGTKWVRVGGLRDVTNTGGGLNVTITEDVANIDLNIDNATLEIGSNVLRIKDLGVTTSKIANNAVTTVKITDKNITFAKINDIPTMTVIGRVATGTGVSSAITIINDNDLVGANGQTLVTSGAVKAYVDAKISGIGTLIGGWNATTSTVFPGDAQTKKGDYWYVTVAGTIQGTPFQVGDVIVANKANPLNTNANDYIFLQTNADQATTTILGLVMLATNAEVQAGTNNTKAITAAGLSSRTATETRTGIARISTTAEATAGTDNTTIMTPAKVKAVVDANSRRGFSAVIGDGVKTEYDVNHGLNTEFVICDFFYEYDKKKVLIDYAPINTGQVRVTTSQPLALNEILMVILPK